MSEQLEIQEELFNNFGKVAVEFGIFEKFCKDHDHQVDISIFSIDPKLATEEQRSIMIKFFDFTAELFFKRILQLREQNPTMCEIDHFDHTKTLFS